MTEWGVDCNTGRIKLALIEVLAKTPSAFISNEAARDIISKYRASFVHDTPSPSFLYRWAEAFFDRQTANIGRATPILEEKLAISALESVGAGLKNNLQFFRKMKLMRPCDSDLLEKQFNVFFESILSKRLLATPATERLHIGISLALRDPSRKFARQSRPRI